MTPATKPDRKATSSESGPTRRSLAYGRHHLAIPGPSVMPDRVLAAMSRQMPNIYDGELIDVSNDVLGRLPGIARTQGHAFIAVGNGHAAWQMAIVNTLAPGARALVLESGIFALGWGALATTAGVETEVLPGSFRDPVDPDALYRRLAADPEHEIDAVLVVQTDTGSSVRNDIQALRAAIDAADHPAMLMVDCIASLGCEPYEMDAWGVDLTVGGSQKGLMTPPGLGLVWAGPRAIEAYHRLARPTGYFDWGQRLEPRAHYELYAGTPPTSHLYAMQEALNMIDEEGGLEAVWARHEVLAGAVWAAVDAWGAPGGLSFNIAEPAHRSWAVTTVNAGSLDPDRLRQLAEDQTGTTLGLGLSGDAAPNFRIGHMGHLNPPMLLGTLGVVEACLGAMDAPMGGSGVAAAAKAISDAIRDL